MLKLLLLLLLPASENGQASQDSLIIYNAYKNNIEELKQMQDYQQWYRLQDSLDRVTACAFARLRTYNKQTYKPAKKHNREGFGEASYYPAPQAVPKPVAYTVINRQTKFTIGADGKTKTPYMERLHFDEDNRLVKVEKLYPAKLDSKGEYVCYE